jgi:hypothetical protein
MPRVLACLLILVVAGCTSAPAAAPTPTTSTAAAPVIGAWHDLVYHERLGVTVLVNGGPESGQAAQAPLELWSWDGSSWRLLSREGPVWRNFAGTAYDSDRGVLIVHGGLQPGGPVLDETWEWDGQTWQRFDAGGDGPGGREGAGMAYDRARKVTVLYGGGDGDQVRSDTWLWNGSVWRQLNIAAPPPRFASFMEFDPVRGAVVLYGGHSVSGGPIALADTWLWDGTAWRSAGANSAPGPRVNAAAVFHTRLGQLLMVGGGDGQNTLTDIWAWDGATWTRVATNALPPRQAVGLAYDAKRDVIVLVGGLDRPGTPDRYQDVWEWQGATFVKVSS